MTATNRETLGTKAVVGSKPQYKFYATPELMAACRKIFDRQGVDFSKGITRLMRLLVRSPETLWPILLGQAGGEAARALAEHTLRLLKEGKEIVLSPDSLGKLQLLASETGETVEQWIERNVELLQHVTIYPAGKGPKEAEEPSGTSSGTSGTRGRSPRGKRREGR